MRIVLLGDRLLAREACLALRQAGHSVQSLAPAEMGLAERCDLMILAHCLRFVPMRIRTRARIGAIGYHPSLLSRHRGASAVEWTVRMRDPIAGGSVYWLDDGADTGALQAQDWCFVQPDDTERTLWRRELAPMSVRLIQKATTEIEAGNIRRMPQNEAVATWEPRLYQRMLRHCVINDIPS